jgi:hypothetical protein
MGKYSTRTTEILQPYMIQTLYEKEKLKLILTLLWLCCLILASFALRPTLSTKTVLQQRLVLTLEL